jgi:hypothetical protein
MPGTNKKEKKLSSLREYSVLKKALPEIPPVLPFQREESFSFGSDRKFCFSLFEEVGF